MKKLVARVLVYKDDDPNGDNSYTMHEEGTKDFEIVANPKAEEKFGVMSDTETVLAHEFGHLIASIQGYPEQLLSGFSWTPFALRIAGEKTANRIARKVWPGLNETALTQAMETYQKAAREPWNQEYWNQE